MIESYKRDLGSDILPIRRLVAGNNNKTVGFWFLKLCAVNIYKYIISYL
jgi:hypothetical protein